MKLNNTSFAFSKHILHMEYLNIAQTKYKDSPTIQFIVPYSGLATEAFNIIYQETYVQKTSTETINNNNKINYDNTKLMIKITITIAVIMIIISTCIHSSSNVSSSSSSSSK